MKTVKFVLLIPVAIVTLLSGDFVWAQDSYSCQTDLTDSDCSFFCESKAEEKAKTCAREKCELSDANSGGSGECEGTYSKSWTYVRTFDAVQHFVGYAIARPKR
jgi:hypothetical protein